jgi:hypothetical protein
VISAAKKAILHVAAQQLQLSRAMYEAILVEQGGVDSSVNLTTAGFEKVMRRLEELGFDNKAKKRRNDRRPAEPVTPDQQSLIAALYAELGWTDPARQAGFAKRQCGKPWPQSRRDANKVIEGQKAILARMQREARA